MFEDPGHRVRRHNLEAEDSVLGSMMLSAEAIAAVVEILQPTTSTGRRTGRSTRPSARIYARGEPVDAITAVEELKRRRHPGRSAARSSVHNLVESVPTPASAAHYARIVVRQRAAPPADRRLGRDHGRGVRRPRGSRDIADEAEQRIYAVARHETRRRSSRIGDLVDESDVRPRADPEPRRPPSPASPRASTTSTS